MHSPEVTSGGCSSLRPRARFPVGFVLLIIGWLRCHSENCRVSTTSVSALVVQTVKNLSAIWVRSLGQRSPVEGNGYPLQYSCLENPMGQRTSWTPQGSKESDTTE